MPPPLDDVPCPRGTPTSQPHHRFKQLRAVLLTDDAAVAEAGGMAGCYRVPAPYGAGWQAAGDIAAQICRLLQVQPLHAPGAATQRPRFAAVLAAAGAATGGSGEGEEESDDVIDMVLLVLHAPNAPGSSGGDDGGGSAGDGVAALEWADSLVRALNQAPGFRDTVLLSFVLGPGQQPLSAAPLLRQEQALLQPGAPAGAGPAAADCPAVRRPLQSFQCAGQERVAVDPHRPALVVHRLRAVIRRVCGAGTAPHLVPGRTSGTTACATAQLPPDPGPAALFYPTVHAPRLQGGPRATPGPASHCAARRRGRHPRRAPAARGGIQAGAGHPSMAREAGSLCAARSRLEGPAVAHLRCGITTHRCM